MLAGELPCNGPDWLVDSESLGSSDVGLPSFEGVPSDDGLPSFDGLPKLLIMFKSSAGELTCVEPSSASVVTSGNFPER
jgi:hypothetical protein